MHVCFDVVPVVTLAIVLFDLESDSKSIEVAVGGTGRRFVPDVRWTRRTPKGCGEAVQDAADLDGTEKHKMFPCNSWGTFTWLNALIINCFA